MVLSLVLRLPYAGTMFFSVDEAVSAVAGQAIWEGGLPYRDAVDHRGPLTYYAYAGLFALFGGVNMTGVHVAYAWLISGLSGLLFLLGKSWGEPRMGGWAALFFAVFSWTNPFHETWAAHTEWLLVTASLLAMLSYAHSRHLARRWPWLLLAGLGFGLAALSKQVGALEGVALAVFLAGESWFQNRSWRKVLVELSLMGGSALLLLAGSAAWFASQGAWDDYLLYVWTYNTDYYLAEMPVGARWLYRLKLVVAFFYNKGLLLGLLFFAGKYLWQQRLWQGPGLPWLAACWAGAALVEAMLGGRAFIHYLIPALPAFALLAAWAWLELRARFPTARWLWLALVAGLALPILLNLLRHRDDYPRDSSISEFEPLTAYLRAEAQPDDRLFVWGFAPELYLTTGLRPASRYSFTNVLSGHIPAVNEGNPDTQHLVLPGTRDTLLAELERHPPQWIADTHPAAHRAYGSFPIDSFPALQRYLAQHYRLDTAFIRRYPGCAFRLYGREMGSKGIRE